MLQHAISKTTCGCSDVGTVAPAEVNLPASQCGLQLQSTAADVALFFAQYAQDRSVLDIGAWLLDLLLVDQHAPSEDQRLRPLS